MIKAKGHSLAFEVPDHVLAFGFLSKVRASRRDYVFHQLGVTTKDDLRGEHAAHGLADRHLRAVAAIVHTAVSDLPKGSRVFVEDHPEDERNGYFFNQVGFEPAEGAADWGTGRGLLVSPAHSIVQKMIETPEFAFVQSAGYSQ
ncbi:MAG TPA: hypothetical protein VLI54_07235 [Bacillota bacterium]|nr:hypothetical protein [Bacillota bacterium]